MPRLESLLGARLDDVGEQHLQRLIDDSVGEAEDLDYKANIYWQGPKKSDLAKDVAAFANHRGGLLIVGMDEDGNAIAKERTPVVVDDSTERTIQAIVADRCHPPVRVLTRQIEGEGGRYLLIAVPRSPIAPHAVQDPGTHVLAYPTRTSGTGTRWLSETEIADRYRNRFSDASAATDVADKRSAAIVEKLDRRQPWFTLAVIPDVPGTVEVDAAGGQRMSVWHRELPQDSIGDYPIYVEMQNARFGTGRFVFTHPHPDPNGDQEYRFELFADGSAVLAVRVGNTTDSGPYAIPDEDFTKMVVGLIGIAARFSVDIAGVSGTALFRGEIIEPQRGTSHHRERSVVLAGLRLSSTGWHGEYGQLPGTSSPFAVEPTTHVFDVAALRRSMPERLVATHLLMRDLVQAFGMPEPRHVTATGAVRHRYFRDEDLTAWATAHGVELDDAIL